MMEEKKDLRTEEKGIGAFTEALASSAPTPAGGGASALAGAVGASLGMMVANLTTGKKKYARYEQELQELIPRLEKLRKRFLRLADEDEALFMPLSRAYKLPRNTAEEQEARARVMETCLEGACRVPVETMEACLEALSVMHRLSHIGTRLAVSDVGIAARLLWASMSGAFLNVVINTREMQDRQRAEELYRHGEALLSEGRACSEAVYEAVLLELLEK